MPSFPRKPPPPPTPLAARWPQHSFNQQISTVTLMSEIAYEGNLFPMVGPMINAHWQGVFPPGALLGRGSCMTPPPPRCPLSSWHPRGGEGWSGDAAEGLCRALRDNSLLSPPWETAFTSAPSLDFSRSGNRSERLKSARMARRLKTKVSKFL